ncbi:Jerky -like [Araneus ventricosus]|uniref:Jerky-like n=1 Tax=Araneus ventricosus TaxID=182803 RepID=A0A4Y2A1Z6_ARAVE|nr:Jerky -like [Araneus ventricosus]
MSRKRKHVSVLLDAKRRTLKWLDAGESIKKIAKELGVGEVTVGDWRRNCAKIEKWSAGDLTPDDCLKNRRTMHKSDYEKTSAALFMWFSQQRSKGMLISGPMLQEKAIYFCQRVKEADNFSASTGWLNRWKKKRYGVRQMTICREKLSADFEAANEFRTELNNLMVKENLTEEQLYNCDETGLNFKRLLSKSLVSRNEKSAPGFKQNKERLTAMCCSNESGKHKLRLLMIRK